MRFPPANTCIYCGDQNSKLTEEHIIPLGLRGSYILPAASCKTCAEITGRFEQICLRGNFDTYRRHFGIRSGRRKPTTDLIPLDVLMPDGRIEHRQVALEDYPRCLTLPEMTEPGFITGVMEAPLFGRWHWHAGSPAELADLTRRLGGEPIVNQAVDFMAFAKLLAKIGHGWACAKIGVDNFVSFLPEFILGKNPKIAGGVVGMSKSISRGKRNEFLHYLDIILITFGSTIYVIVEVHLFSNSTPFRYAVVAGILAPGNEAGWKWVETEVTSEADRRALVARFGGPQHILSSPPRIDDAVFFRRPDAGGT